mmetsp:Transcript_97557/g.119495  ORF Transcript_97557/g.119495 Transcript_97557/m.119495 type:complete len:383 (+) Transcript_97557:37-1185(+)
MCRKGCCKYCTVFFPPILVALQLGGWTQQKLYVRQVGLTDFANPTNYEAFHLTDRHREEFFRDGATLLKGVLKPELVKKLHDYIAPIPYWDERNLGNLWMLSDEILDFYLYGPLGAISAQLFQSPQAETSGLAPSAQLQRDFISRRQLDTTNGWHIDRTECQVGDQPSKFLSSALARLAVPLVFEGGVRGTQIINQSKYAAAMSEEERADYYAGKAVYRKEGRFERGMFWDPNIVVPRLPGVQLDKDMIMEHWIEPGDIVLFNTCLWHRSPPWAGPEPELGLQPTFAPATHINHNPDYWADGMATWCFNDDYDSAGKAVGEGEGSPCFPYAYPEEKRPKVNSTMTFKRRPIGRPRHYIASFLWLQLRDQLRKVQYFYKSLSR